MATGVTAGHTFPLLPTTSMQTCSSSPPQPPPEVLPPPHPPKASGRVRWTEADEIVLIDYIAGYKAKAGDGTKLRRSFWTGAAKEMSTLGGVKTPQGCMKKWDQVCIKLHFSVPFTNINLSSSRGYIMLLLHSKPTYLDSVAVR